MELEPLSHPGAERLRGALPGRLTSRRAVGVRGHLPAQDTMTHSEDGRHGPALTKPPRDRPGTRCPSARPSPISDPWQEATTLKREEVAEHDLLDV